MENNSWKLNLKLNIQISVNILPLTRLVFELSIFSFKISIYEHYNNIVYVYFRYFLPERISSTRLLQSVDNYVSLLSFQGHTLVRIEDDIGLQFVKKKITIQERFGSQGYT